MSQSAGEECPRIEAADPPVIHVQELDVSNIHTQWSRNRGGRGGGGGMCPPNIIVRGALPPPNMFLNFGCH